MANFEKVYVTYEEKLISNYDSIFYYKLRYLSRGKKSDKLEEMQEKPIQTPEKPYITRPALLMAVLLLLFGLQVTKQFLLPKPSEADDLSPSNISASVNSERSVRNLASLSTNDKLSRAAQTKADDMQARHYFSHTNPEGEYIWPLISKEGYSPYLQLGENLAIEFYNTESLMSAWMNSPTHRANILNENFRDQGLGLTLGNVQNAQYYSAVVNTFGALIPAKKQTTEATPKPVTKTPTPAPVKKPAANPKPVIKAEPAPAAAPVKTEAPKSNYVPFAIRGAEEKPSFSLPPENQSTTTHDTSTTTDNTEARLSENAVIASAHRTNIKNNRTIALGIGFLLFYMLARDIFFTEKRLGDHKDKKINNLVLLILSLIVVAVMYWL